VKRVAATALALVALVGAALAMGANGGGDDDDTSYRIVFDNAFGLTDGGDFRIAGVRAGVIDDLRISKGYPPNAVVDVTASEPGFADLREDATCEVRPQSLIGEYFVDCQPGDSGRRLRDGGRVPVEQTTSTIPFDLVNTVMRMPQRQRFRLIISELGAGLAGRPEDLSEVLRRAHPGLRETTQALRILGRQTRTIERLISDADRVIGELERRKRDVVRFVEEAGRTAEITASRRADLAANFRLLPRFLAALRPNMARLGELADAQIPLLRDLNATSGELDALLRVLRPFSINARPAFRALGRGSEAGLDAIRATNEEIEVLRQVARNAPPTVKPLRQLLQTIDDRSRAVENDPRAKATDPPAPDKTHIPASQQGGFTGMEGLWNYYYWQALSTNAFDSIGHILRISATLDLGGCSAYFTTITAETRDCQRWLGPYQPGVNAPDPTEIPGEEGEGGTPATEPTAAAARDRATEPTAAAARDRAAEPTAAGARAAQPALPPAPDPAPASDAEVLLDYLLGP
jgi:phospholipid/cholesterol/gamma-HCH transport system substrate-binding protein